MKRVHVAAGIIYRDEKVLLAKRPDHLHQGGLWEFPGGKVEPGEDVSSALKRELHEELAIHVRTAKPFTCIEHDYPDKQVRLDFWLVDDFQGDERGCEGQEIEWVSIKDLPDYNFPEANRLVVKKLMAEN